jgi:sugar phosphate isomerase/epimerase
MKQIELVHFAEWKKIAGDAYEKTMNDLVSWGVSKIVAHPCWGMNDETAPGYFDNCAALLKKYALETPACHAYWGAGNDISPADPAELETIVPRHAAFLEKLAAIGVRSYTMHIAMESNGSTPWKTIAQAVENLLPTARRCNIILALENGHEDCATQQQLADFVSSYCDPFLGVCYDTGHAHCYGDREWKRTLDILAPHIVTCHLHDNSGTFDDHNPPGGGTINWAEMSAALKSLPRLLHAETESGDWSQDSWNKFRDMWYN